MRMSRRMGLIANHGDAMYPSSVTVNSGCAMNYWASSSSTSDKWHSTVPYTDDSTWLGYNSNGIHHNAAICFTSGAFIGKAKQFSFSLTCSGSWGSTAVTFAWQLSKHNWKTAAAWAAGGKDAYYITDTWGPWPNDPYAIADGHFDTTGASIKFSGEVEIEPNTQYVFYLWRRSAASKGMLVGMSPTNSIQPKIILSE